MGNIEQLKSLMLFVIGLLGSMGMSSLAQSKQFNHATVLTEDTIHIDSSNPTDFRTICHDDAQRTFTFLYGTLTDSVFDSNLRDYINRHYKIKPKILELNFLTCNKRGLQKEHGIEINLRPMQSPLGLKSAYVIEVFNWIGFPALNDTENKVIAEIDGVLIVMTNKLEDSLYKIIGRRTYIYTINAIEDYFEDSLSQSFYPTLIGVADGKWCLLPKNHFAYWMWYQ